MADKNKPEAAREPDRYLIESESKTYNGHHPAAGLRFINGQAFTDDVEVAERADGLGLRVKLVKRPEPAAAPTPAKK